MPTNTPDQAIPIPAGSDPADLPVGLANAIAVMEPILERRYASTAARAAQMLSLYYGAPSVLPTRVDGYDGTNHVSFLEVSQFLPTARVTVAPVPVNNSTGLVNIASLVIAGLPTTGTFQVKAKVWYSSSTTADIKFAWTFPAGATARITGVGLDVAATTVAGDAKRAVQTVTGTANSFAGIGVGTTVDVDFEGILTMGGAGGSLQLQYAQQTLDATNTQIEIMSNLRMWQIA